MRLCVLCAGLSSLFEIYDKLTVLPASSLKRLYLPSLITIGQSFDTTVLSVLAMYCLHSLCCGERPFWCE